MTVAPTSPVVSSPQSSGANSFSQSLSPEALKINNSNLSPLDQQKAFADLNAKGGTYSPTVMTDSNIRETVIPDVKNKSDNLLGQTATKTTGDQTKGDTSGSSGNSYEDVYKNAFESDSVQSIGSDPITTSILQSIKDMQSKSDASTAAQLEGIHAGFQARQDLLKESQESTSGLLRGLLMTDGSYRTGSGVSLISAKEKGDIQNLTNLSNEETSAKAAVYKAKQESDFQLMDKMNTLLEGIQTKKLTLAGKIADSITTKNKEDRAYNLEVEKFNHDVSNDEKTQAREEIKLKQGEYEFRDMKDEFGNTIGTQVFSKSSGKPISVIGAPGSDKPGLHGVLNPVQVTNDGVPDPKQQSDFLKGLPPNIAQMVKDLSNYQMNPANISIRGNTRATILNYAHQFDPTFDETQYSARAAFNKNWTSGQLMTNRNAINTVTKHIDTLAKAGEKLLDVNKGGIFGSKRYNSIAQLIKSEASNPDVIAYNQAKEAVASEMAKVYKGGTAAPTEDEIKNQIASLEKTLSPDQFKTAINTSIELMTGRLSTIADEYRQTMGKEPEGLIGDSSLKALNSLKDRGYNIDIPGTFYTNKDAYLKSNPTDGPEKLKTAFDHLQKAGIPATPENILQYAQSI